MRAIGLACAVLIGIGGCDSADPAGDTGGAIGGSQTGGVSGTNATVGAAATGATSNAGAGIPMGSASAGNPAAAGGTFDSGAENPFGSDGGGTTGLTPDKTPPIVVCGGVDCDISTGFMCCEGYSKEVGFVGGQECIPESACQGKYDAFSAEDHIVQHYCDGPEDCGSGDVCCFVAFGMPIQDTPLLPPTGDNVVGPGAGRQCAAIADCNSSLPFAGTALGIIACHTDADCTPYAGTTCQPEEAGGKTTARDGSPRAGVLACR